MTEYEEMLRRTWREELRPLEKVVPTFILTFDDGYAVQYDHMKRLADDYGIKATAFPYIDAVDTGLIDAEPAMTWEQLRELVEMGHEVGSHTVTHRDLPGLTDAEILAELKNSKERLEAELKIEVETLAYPGGAWDSKVVRMAKEVGYKLARTTGPPAPGDILTNVGAFRSPYPHPRVYQPYNIPAFWYPPSAVLGLINTALFHNVAWSEVYACIEDPTEFGAAYYAGDAEFIVFREFEQRARKNRPHTKFKTSFPFQFAVSAFWATSKTVFFPPYGPRRLLYFEFVTKAEDTRFRIRSDKQFTYAIPVPGVGVTEYVGPDRLYARTGQRSALWELVEYDTTALEFVICNRRPIPCSEPTYVHFSNPTGAETMALAVLEYLV